MRRLIYTQPCSFLQSRGDEVEANAASIHAEEYVTATGRHRTTDEQHRMGLTLQKLIDEKRLVLPQRKSETMVWNTV